MVREPTKATLRKYGLVLPEWRAILERQGGVCAICGQVTSSGRLVTDHEHVRGWKKLPPAMRARTVRQRDSEKNAKAITVDALN